MVVSRESYKVLDLVALRFDFRHHEALPRLPRHDEPSCAEHDAAPARGARSSNAAEGTADDDADGGRAEARCSNLSPFAVGPPRLRLVDN